MLFLMVVAFVPFPTRVLAEQPARAVEGRCRLLRPHMTAMAVCYGALWFYAAHGRRLIAATADQRIVTGISRSFRPGTLIYAVATLSALVSSILAVVIFALIALFYVIESSLFGRE